MNLKSILLFIATLFLIFGLSAKENPKDSLANQSIKPVRIYNTTLLTIAKPTIDGV